MKVMSISFIPESISIEVPSQHALRALLKDIIVGRKDDEKNVRKLVSEVF